MSDPLESRFLEVLRDHTGAIVKTALAFTHNPADRADLCQEIRFALWQALPHFQGRARISTYVYRVAHSCALNWKRSRQRYSRKLDLYAVEPSDEGPETEADRDPRLAWLYARIQELPPVDRSVILLSLDRLTYAEIAEITGLSESNVGVRLHRIKHHLAAQSERLPHEL